MDADRAQHLKRLFDQASDLSALRREEFLASQCKSDDSLRADVERLLRADAPHGGGGFLSEVPAAFDGSHMPPHVGRFRLLRKIGEGGMGAVFEAEQDQPRRRVALKMVRSPAMSASLLRRFEHEVQILGQLKHPGIAQVYEAGAHDAQTGPVPYFAMEYIHGRPLLEFASSRSLTLRQRLELACKICDAVHHAHQKGVIHRDLKPANILVEENDTAEPQPKVLDFGVARATQADFELLTMHTEVGQLVGTLSYMSPEQVAGKPDEIDVRSDVYALGVLLYELLAGRLPYELRGRSISDAGVIICEQEPSRLSSIDSRYRGDIETVVAKALAKEKERRYQSAAELGADIRRCLHDEPIVARPASRSYQVRKFAKRNKGLVGGVVAVFLVLVAGLVGISWALVRTQEARQAAMLSAAKATSVSRFLQNMLAGVDPEEIGPRALTVREVLDHAAQRLETELGDQPDVAASIHQTLGNHYSTLGHFIEADHHLRKSVELRRAFTVDDDPELAQAIFDMAANLQEKREIADAEAPTREALEMRRRLFGNDSLEVAASLHDLASILVELWRPREAEPLARASLEIRRRHLGSHDAAVATSYGMLGWCLMALGRMDEAEAAIRDAVEMVRQLPGDNERALAGRLTFLTDILRARGNLHEEEVVLREAIEIRSRRLAEDHPALAWNLLCLAQVRRKIGDLDEAESACRKALAIYLKRRGPIHGDVADSLELLAMIHEDRGQFADAQSLWDNCLSMRRSLLPPDHPDIALAENAMVKNRAVQRNIPRVQAGAP